MLLSSALKVDASSPTEDDMTTETTAPALELVGDYQIDPAHTRIGFTARHAMVTKVRGSFGEFRGTAHIDADPAQSSVELDGDVYNITGDLTIRDTTKPVTIPFEFTGLAKDPFGNVRAGFEGST